MFGPIIILIGVGVTIFEAAKRKQVKKAALDASRTVPTPEKPVESTSQDPPAQS